MAYTITSLCTEARAVLQDVKSTGSPNGTRYSDQDLIDAFNDALMQTRMRRPDVFLDIGLRNAIPQYSAADVAGGTPFPIDNTYYPALLFYVVGRCELRDDTFSDDNRAMQMMKQFVSQIMGLA